MDVSFGILERVCYWQCIDRLRDLVSEHPTRVSQSMCLINGTIVLFMSLLAAAVSVHDSL